VSGIQSLWQPDGFMPHGLGAVMSVTMFSFMGTEIVTIAAAESPDPTTGISKAVNSVIWRISLSNRFDLRHRRADALRPARRRVLPVDVGRDRDAWVVRSSEFRCLSKFTSGTRLPCEKNS
jgi:hypothetical protein